MATRTIVHRIFGRISWLFTEPDALITISNWLLGSWSNWLGHLTLHPDCIHSPPFVVKDRAIDIIVQPNKPLFNRPANEATTAIY